MNVTASSVRRGVAALVAVVALALVGSGRAEAKPTFAIDASLSSGIDADATLLGRVMGGGLMSFGKFALDAHLSFEAFLRLSDAGVSARSFGIANLGLRYAFLDEKYTGPFVSAGGGFGIISGNPKERRLSDDIEVCEGRGTMADPNSCTFEIDKTLNARLGFGWGFASGSKTTVAVRFDVSYWAFSVAGDQEPGSPPARTIDRPQDDFIFTLGIEFMRWP